MELTSADGNRLSLEIVGFEFPTAAHSVERDYDTNWLIVSGHVVVRQESWRWQDACITTSEARRLAQWLRAVADGSVRPARLGVEHHGAEQLAFLEPVLSFNVAECADGFVTLQVFLDYEALPDGETDVPLILELTIRSEQMEDAARQWDRELAGVQAQM